MSKTLDFFSSMKLAVFLFIIIAAASFAGTFMPQEKANAVIYHSFWFIALMGCLIINTIACLLKKAFNRKTAGSWLMHAGIPVIMLGAMIGAIAGVNGMMVIEEGKTMDTIQTAGGHFHKLPFSVTLNDFILEKNPEIVTHSLLITGSQGKVSRIEFKGENVTVSAASAGYDIKIERILPDFVMGEDKKPASRSGEWRNPAVLISVKKTQAWLFALYPDFHGAVEWPGKSSIGYEMSIKGGGVSSYISDITITQEKSAAISKKIEVNRPYNHKGFSIYQSTYDDKRLKWSGLYVKNDPGIPVVYFGFLLLCAGMFMQAFSKISVKEGVEK